MLPQDCEYIVMFHFRCPGSWCCPGFSVGFIDGRAALNEQFDHLSSSPTAGPSQWSRLEQIVAQVQPGAAVEQHGSEPRAVFFSHLAVISSRKVQGSLTEARHIGVDSVLQEHGHAAEVAGVLRRIGSRAADGLNDDPVPSVVIRRPAEVGKRQFNNLRAAMIGCRPD